MKSKPSRNLVWPGRILVLAFAACLCAGRSQAEVVELRSQAATGQITHVEALLEVGGELMLPEKDQVKNVKMSVAGKMGYDEKLISVAAADKKLASVRHYGMAEATIKIETGGVQPRLRPERRYVVVEASEDHAQMFSPSGPMTREELDLIDLPGNSLLLDRLLPAEAVGPGSRWTHADDLLAMLLGLDAVSEADVHSELRELDATAARMELSGHVKGAVGGVSTELELKGRYKFHRGVGRVTWFALLIEEKRSIGHIGPGADVVARLQLTVTAAGQAPELNDEVLNAMPREATPDLLGLEYTAPKQPFAFHYDRRWYPTLEKSETIAMRLLDRGALVAQCNIAQLPKTDRSAPTTLAEFQEDVERALAKNFQRFLQASQSQLSSGNTMYRVVAEGNVAELPIQWVYYLIRDAQGRQAVVAFTIEGPLTAQLGEADQQIVNSLEFHDVPLTAAAEAGESKSAR